ncbi:MAG: chemotaxis protein CheW, partial [Gammaproteobacteria bacterium]|nr:chemotaxis protein CheW [Gammaproteobacteria bacterium]
MAIKKLQDADALLLYKVGPVFCCSPTLTVEAVILPPKLTHAPGYSEAEPGVFKHACGIVHVVDLRKRFGVERENWKDPGKIIVVEIEGGYAGFWVDEILDVMHFPEKGWSNVPACIPRTVFKRTLLLKNDIQLYCDFEALFKFKETGYLREYIAGLKIADVSGKVSDAESDVKNIISNSRFYEKDEENSEELSSKATKNKSVVELTGLKEEINSTESEASHKSDVIKSKNIDEDSKGKVKQEASYVSAYERKKDPGNTFLKGHAKDFAIDVKPLNDDVDGSLSVEKSAAYYNGGNVKKEALADDGFDKVDDADDNSGFLLVVFGAIFIAVLVFGYWFISGDVRQDLIDKNNKLDNSVMITESAIDDRLSEIDDDLPLINDGAAKKEFLNHAQISRQEDTITIVISEAKINEPVINEQVITDSEAKLELSYEQV